MSVQVINQALSARSVTPADTDFAVPAEGFWIGVAGDVGIKNIAGETVVLTGLSAGVVHPIPCKQIRSTGTTATGIFALFPVLTPIG